MTEQRDKDRISRVLEPYRAILARSGSAHRRADRDTYVVRVRVRDGSRIVHKAITVGDEDAARYARALIKCWRRAPHDGLNARQREALRECVPELEAAA